MLRYLCSHVPAVHIIYVMNPGSRYFGLELRNCPTHSYFTYVSLHNPYLYIINNIDTVNAIYTLRALEVYDYT